MTPAGDRAEMFDVTFHLQYGSTTTYIFLIIYESNLYHFTCVPQWNDHSLIDIYNKNR